MEDRRDNQAAGVDAKLRYIMIRKGHYFGFFFVIIFLTWLINYPHVRAFSVEKTINKEQESIEKYLKEHLVDICYHGDRVYFVSDGDLGVGNRSDGTSAPWKTWFFLTENGKRGRSKFARISDQYNTLVFDVLRIDRLAGVTIEYTLRSDHRPSGKDLITIDTGIVKLWWTGSGHPFDDKSVAARKEIIKTLMEKGEILKARLIAWLLLYNHKVHGGNNGAWYLLSTYDLSNPSEVAYLLALNNSCVLNEFVDRAAGGWLAKFPVAQQTASLLGNEEYIRTNRQFRVVKLLRALYHFGDKSVASQVAPFLEDANPRIRKTAARTLGHITGHTFARTGEYDFTPTAYYVAKARAWWFMNQNNPKYKPKEPPINVRPFRAEAIAEDTSKENILRRIKQLGTEDLLIWTEAFRTLLEYGVNHDWKRMLDLLSLNEFDPEIGIWIRELELMIEVYSEKKLFYINKSNLRKAGIPYNSQKYCP